MQDETKPPRAPPLPFGVEAQEDSQLDPRADDERQDWPGSPGSDQLYQAYERR